MALFSGQVEAGGKTVGLCLSWMPSVGGRVTPCGVYEDLRWSRTAMSNPSTRPGGYTFKTRSEATPFSPSPLPLCGPSCPCLVPGCQSPHFCPGYLRPLLTMGGTGTLLINIVALVPTLFKMVHSFMATKHLHVCQLFTVPSALQSLCPCAVLSPSIVSDSLRLHGLPPGSSVHGIPQARIMEWVAIFSSRGSSGPRDQTLISCASHTGRWILYCYTTWEAPSGDTNVHT